MLHFLLVKMYPLAYKPRQNQVLEDEKKMGTFSPDIHQHCQSLSSTSSNLDLNKEGEESVKANDKEICDIPIEGRSCSGSCEQVSVADLSCVSCKQLLFRPVVLNCGHVYCETCLVVPKDETLKCDVCESPHPRGFPKVCVELHHFLEEKFPTEYALRKNIAQLNHPLPKETETTSSSATGDNDKEGIVPSQWPSESRPKVHVGVGCDSCGMYPIVGDRYKCNDCVEAVGFDLCGDCYNTRSKLPGRFNQKHTSEHTFNKITGTITEIMLAIRHSQPHNDFDFSELTDEEQEEEEPLENQLPDLDEEPLHENDDDSIEPNFIPPEELALIGNSPPHP
jgi:hypothetical protein